MQEERENGCWHHVLEEARGGRVEGMGCPCWEHPPLLSTPAGGRASTARGTGRCRVGREKLANAFDVLFWCASIFLAESVDQEEVRNVRRDEKA